MKRISCDNAKSFTLVKSSKTLASYETISVELEALKVQEKETLTSHATHAITSIKKKNKQKTVLFDCASIVHTSRFQNLSQ